jgi:hypothetical protein
MDMEKKKTSEIHQNYDNDTTSKVWKIFTRLIQKHQGMSSTMTGVYHTSYSNANEFWYIWITHVAYSGHRLWHFLVLLNLSCWYFFNCIGDVIIRVLMCLRAFPPCFSLCSLVFFYCKLCQFIFEIEVNCIWHLRPSTTL